MQTIAVLVTLLAPAPRPQPWQYEDVSCHPSRRELIKEHWRAVNAAKAEKPKLTRPVKWTVAAGGSMSDRSNELERRARIDAMVRKARLELGRD